MSLKLKITASGTFGEIAAQLTLPTDSQTFTMNPTGARQLAGHLLRLADLVEGAE
jgi:hypothetical protein